MSGSARVIRSDFRGLHQLVKAVGDGSVVRVGILAGKAQRNEAGKLAKGGGHKVSKEKAAMTNAEIGAVHEFGSFSRNIPKRSFLREPIFHEAKKIIKDAAAALPAAVESGKMKGVLNAIGISALAAVQRAFASGGLGRPWEKLKPSTTKAKRSSAPLIDTGQLRRSITWQVGKPT